jgi:hypothetical protein
MERAREGQILPQSMGIPRARARLPESLATAPRECDLSEAAKNGSANKNLPAFKLGESQPLTPDDRCATIPTHSKATDVPCRHMLV